MNRVTQVRTVTTPDESWLHACGRTAAARGLIRTRLQAQSTTLAVIEGVGSCGPDEVNRPCGLRIIARNVLGVELITVPHPGHGGWRAAMRLSTRKNEARRPSWSTRSPVWYELFNYLGGDPVLPITVGASGSS